MLAVRSRLDGPAARGLAAATAVAALGLIGWLVCLDNRSDPRIAACIARHSAAIVAARDSGKLPEAVAERFLAQVAPSCVAQLAPR